MGFYGRSVAAIQIFLFSLGALHIKMNVFKYTSTAKCLIRSSQFKKGSMNWLFMPKYQKSYFSDEGNKKVNIDYTSKLSFKEPKKIPIEEAGKSKEEKERDNIQNEHILVQGPMDVTLSSGVPEEHIKGRYVRIYQPSKSSSQAGSQITKRWKIEFDTRERWENNLMGWTSSGDPLSNMIVDFSSKEEAIRFVEKNGWDYWVEEAKIIGKIRPKSYAENFTWSKRSRVWTK